MDHWLYITVQMLTKQAPILPKLLDLCLNVATLRSSMTMTQNYFWHKCNSTMMIRNNKGTWNSDWLIFTITSWTKDWSARNLSLHEDFWTLRSKWGKRNWEPRKKRKSTIWWKSLPGSVLRKNIRNWSEVSLRRNRSGRGFRSWKSTRRKGLELWLRFKKRWRTRERSRKRTRKRWKTTFMGLDLGKR